MRNLKEFVLEIARASLWPTYVVVLGYAARVGPWPRSLAQPASFVLTAFAITFWVARLARVLLRPAGWVEEFTRLPADVTRQIRRAATALMIAAAVCLIPQQLLVRGLISGDARPLLTPLSARLLAIGFEASIAWILLRLARPSSPLVRFVAQFRDAWAFPGRRPRLTQSVLAAASAGVLALEVMGYTFTARRLGVAAAQSLSIILVSLFVHWFLQRVIERHSWRWVRKRSGYGDADSGDLLDRPDLLARRLSGLVHLVVPALGLLAAASVWNVDLALFKSVGALSLWPIDADKWVTAGDVVKAAVIVLVTSYIWRNLSAFFAIAVYPRMRDDAGLQFAALSLCRYLVLGVGILSALASIRLGLEKIGVVLAALGVGLGFGLQEIVSNFVSGLILLIERPIRVGDTVSVGDMTGKVDRINIRATTIINSDNHCIIVPNREFITTKLVNWTHKDKIVRVSLAVSVAYGTDPARTADLLLAIARGDADVLKNPVPSASLESLGDSGLVFGLYVHVPEPGLAGRVRHRLYSEIQRRFDSEAIEIPYPIRELRVRSTDDGDKREKSLENLRFDPPRSGAPDPNLRPTQAAVSAVAPNPNVDE